MPEFYFAMRSYTSHLHSETENCMRFISGRAALGCILEHMTSIHRALIPLFTCDTVLEPFTLRRIPVQHYRISEDFSPILPTDSTADDLLLLTNYFGFTGEQVERAAAAHPGPVIIDAATALYAPPPAGIPCFYSPRKFCHTPTGGLATAPFPLTKLPPRDNTDWQQMMLAEANHCEQMQVIRLERALRHRTERLSLQRIEQWGAFDWDADAAIRCKNYSLLHKHLQSINRLQLPAAPLSAPMCYPLLSGIPNLRDDLADAGLHLPLFWPEVIRRTTATDWENYLARNLLPLPLGPNMTEADMWRILRLMLDEN